MTHTLDTPEQLAALLGENWTFSPQQWAAVTAPLEPAVVIAGAGSGKTTVMAARVVWLVATGRVAPGEILGLTFTTKATAELQTRIRENLRKAGLLPERATRVGDDEEEVEEPTVSTYHSYASALLSEHGLRIGHEPDTRLIADASRYQLATRAVQRYTSPVDQLTDSPAPRRPVPPRPRRRDERAPRRPRDRPGVRRRASGRGSSTGWPPSTARPTARRTRRRSPPSTSAPS